MTWAREDQLQTPPPEPIAEVSRGPPDGRAAPDAGGVERTVDATSAGTSAAETTTCEACAQTRRLHAEVEKRHAAGDRETYVYLSDRELHHALIARLRADLLKGTIFEDVCSDAQLARPVGDRYSLSDEQIVSVRALVRNNTDLARKTSEAENEIQRLRAGVSELRYLNGTKLIHRRAEALLAEKEEP